MGAFLRRAAAGICTSDKFVIKESLSLGTVGQSYDGHKPSEKPHAVGDLPKVNPKPAKTNFRL